VPIRVQRIARSGNPKPKWQNAEPLLNFPSGALVHFAVSNREVYMATRLEGPATTFLPFNKGDNGARADRRDAAPERISQHTANRRFLQCTKGTPVGNAEE
jgi:hypothetical protein